jgi:hypothetical protein
MAKSDTQIIAAKLARPLIDAADALTDLADTVREWVTLEQQRYSHEHPNITINPASVGIAKYPDEKKDKPEEEGALFPESRTVGPREAALLASEERRAKRSLAAARRKA